MKISAKSNIVLGALLAVSVISIFLVENFKVREKTKWYDEKIKAAKISEQAAKFIKDFRLKKGVFIDPVNDPNETALIGDDITPITTDRGNIDAKLTSTNPNFAAVFVELLKKAGVKKGDKIAVAVTGSFPALNISLYAAMKVLNLKPVIITSVGSSNWGANIPEFTWLDMESALYENGVFQFKSVAASIGGGLDRGRGLSPKGRKLILEAIERNGVKLINEDFLSKSISKRIKIYDKKTGGKIAAYVNIGGGIASLGAAVNGQIIPTGLSEHLGVKNYPMRGVIIEMASRNVPIIHVLRVMELAKKYGLPVSPEPLPEPGEGKTFVKIKYNFDLTLALTLILSALIAVVYFAEKKRNALGSSHIYTGEKK
jgi:poly-gamma-glutamate system protein